MIAASVVSGLKVDGGVVVSGQWYCFYTGKIYDIETVTPDLDHVVPLKAAHMRGGHDWDYQKRKKFANDPYNLVVVLPGANRQKSAMVSKWLPPNIANGRDYIAKIRGVIDKYDLEATRHDKAAYLFLVKKIEAWGNGIRLDPVKDWFRKTFNMDID